MLDKTAQNLCEISLEAHLTFCDAMEDLSLKISM